MRFCGLYGAQRHDVAACTLADRQASTFARMLAGSHDGVVVGGAATYTGCVAVAGWGRRAWKWYVRSGVGMGSACRGYCSATSVWEPPSGGRTACGAVGRRASRSVSGTMPPYRSIARCIALTS